MLESNQCMEAEWILAQHILGIEDDPKYAGIVRAILDQQRDDGSWEVYFDAPNGDINATVECYAALRASGLLKDDPRLVLARDWILSHGGLQRVRVFTRYWLAMLGEWPWAALPSIPPELIRFPTWGPLHLYSFASWARATMIPLAVLSAKRPVRPLPEGRRLDELFPEGREQFEYRIPNDARFGSIAWLFHQADRVLSIYAKSPIRPFRESSIRRCLGWLLQRQDADGAWGGIQPPTIYSLIALHAEGYELTHPVVEKGLRSFDAHWSYERDGATRLQASDSIVWDTLLTMLGLFEAGRTPSNSDELTKAIDWILDQQVLVKGDWSLTVKGVAPGGWAFERANLHYPDCDDTALAILVLKQVRSHFEEDGSRRQRIDLAVRRGETWLRAMQSKNGGWGAFDRDNNNRLAAKIPFADFGEMLDPPSVDVTAHAVEAILADAGKVGTADPLEDQDVARAVRYMLDEQEPDGSWFGRWGVNHVYGTGSVLPALRAAGLPGEHPALLKAGRWFQSHQNEDGGWGETPGSYMDDSLRGQGPSTVSQAAWAIIGMLSLDDDEYDPAIQRGLEYLIQQQRPDGTWDEPQFTGTGFPGYGVGKRRIKAKRKTSTDSSAAFVSLQQGVELERGFMINYNLYRHYFPLIAMARARGRNYS